MFALSYSCIPYFTSYLDRFYCIYYLITEGDVLEVVPKH
jgi:hypothetical protein